MTATAALQQQNYFTFGTSPQFGYREICDVTILGADRQTRVLLSWPVSATIWIERLHLDIGGQGGITRWVAAPGDELILGDRPCRIEANPNPLEIDIVLIYDVERRKELLPRSLLDLRWNYVADWDDHDCYDYPIYRIRWPFIVFRRRRKYPPKKYMERIIWTDGFPVSSGAIALDHMDPDEDEEA
jgi:hypothetical protein